jgi:uncharacterized protein (UPF0333 family)
MEKKYQILIGIGLLIVLIIIINIIVNYYKKKDTTDTTVNDKKDTTNSTSVKKDTNITVNPVVDVDIKTECINKGKKYSYIDVNKTC